jgi:RNA polymerase sigma-70 factor (ECF subfamily)
MDAALTDCTVPQLQSQDTAERNRAWRQLYDANFSPVYRLACRSGVLPADAEEVVQKVFLVAHRKLNDTAEIKNLTGWLYGITLRVVSQHYRWKRVRKVKGWMLPDSDGVIPSQAVSPEAAATSAGVQMQVNQVMSAMSAKLRDVLVLIEIEDLRPQEAADILGIPVNTLRSRRRLAHEDFRRRWQKYVEQGAGS